MNTFRQLQEDDEDQGPKASDSNFRFHSTNEMNVKTSVKRSRGEIEYEREVFVFSSPGVPGEKVPPSRNDTNWRDLDWSVLTTVAFTGPMEPELICYAHARGVRVLLGWDTGAFCPGWQADSINATSAQR